MCNENDSLGVNGLCGKPVGKSRYQFGELSDNGEFVAYFIRSGNQPNLLNSQRSSPSNAQRTFPPDLRNIGCCFDQVGRQTFLVLDV